MTKEEFRKVLNKYLEGTATPLETAYVERWYESVQESEDMLPAEIEDAGEKIYSKIKDKITAKPKRVSFSKQWFFRVAAILVLTFAGLFFYRYVVSPVKKPIVGIIQPGSEKAVLKLADGSLIMLDSTTVGNLGSDGGSEIVKLEDGTLVYHDLNATEGKEAKYNEISIPAGGHYKLKLPDGSLVWLNSVSSIRFPTKFVGKERRVILKGEAYFEIAHDKAKPFIVDVQGKQQISVLGTHFNVSAYEGDNVKTTLLQGSVKVAATGGKAPVILRPGQQSVVKPGGNIVMHSDIHVEQVLAWKNGYFLFERTEISEITAQISRWYDAKIELDPRLKGETFSGKIQRTESIYKLLKIFETTNTVKYSVEGSQIRIYQKQ